MNNDKKNMVTISANITHGTAKQISIPSVIPTEKSKKEVFWVRELTNKLKDQYEFNKIESNDDDSHGKDDVIITLNDKSEIGVQITELTYELERARTHIKENYINKILNLIQTKDIQSIDKVIFKINFPYTESTKPVSEKPKKIVDIISNIISTGIENKVYKFDYGTIYYQKITEGDFYIQNKNNIGVDVNFDNLPRSLGRYFDCIDAIVRKKSKSLSSWLLIWSLEFWRDKHIFEDKVIEHMKNQFNNTKFDKVFFIESMDGNGLFQTNIKLHEIKSKD